MQKLLIISPNSLEDHCDRWINYALSVSPYENEVEIEYISPEVPISENVNLLDCLAIKEMLCNMDLSSYAGMILIHGTEYIPFTCAALNLLLTQLELPLFVITQNTLLSQKANYHIDCFNAAVGFILNNKVPGVFNVIKNELSSTLEVHYGARISQSTPFNFQYTDVLSGRYGDIINGEFHFKHGSTNPSLKELKNHPRQTSPFHKLANVTYIRAYRRMPYHYYNFAASKPDAVLHELYDLSSVLCNEGINALTAFSEHCKKHNTPLYLCPLVEEDLDYEKVLAPILKNGAILIRNMTVFTAYAKLVYGYGDGKVKHYLNTNFSFENF